MSETISWIDADGAVTPFTGDIKVLGGVKGRFMPPTRFVTDEVPEQHGELVRQATFAPRTVDVPIRIAKADDTTLRTALRALLPSLNPVRGDGKLRVTAPDASQRELTCRYLGGMEIEEGPDTKTTGYQKAVLLFRAYDPFWYDLADTADLYDTGDRVVFLSENAGDPFLPFTLVSDTVLASPVISNNGDVEAWPVWTVTGPGSNVVVRNLTTGKRLEIAKTLVGGQSIVIDTRPRRKTVTLNDGTNLFSLLTSDSALWPLEVGVNNVSVEMAGATSASSIALSYRKGYLGA